MVTAYITIYLFLQEIKGGVSDFWKPMLIFEITKTNMPLAQISPLFWSLPPHTYCSLRNPGND